LERNEIGVALLGYKFMGRTHSNAYRQVGRFFDLDLAPRMSTLVGRDEAAVREAAENLGWEGYSTDYAEVLSRDDIGLVDVSTPGDSHKDLALAALEAGKHVFCEKPLANTLSEAREMAEAAERAGVVNVVNFNYRKAPAVALAKRLVEEGRIGNVRHWRAVYLQDWILSPEFPLVWRLQKDKAGSGALGDIGAHIVDLALHIVGPIAEVTGTMKTFIEERPLEESSDGLSANGSAQTGPVTVDDAAAFLARFESGAMGTFEASRMVPGRRNRNSFEINGSRGSLVFDLERMNELKVYFVDDDADVQGFRDVIVTEPGAHPYVDAWWPPGHILGYEHTFVHAVKDLMDGIAADKSPSPTFGDGFRCQAVLDAVEKSAEERAWVTPEGITVS